MAAVDNSRIFAWGSRLTARTLLVGFCLSTPAAWAAADSAREAVRAAIERNPEVQTRWHAFLAAGEDKAEARGGYLPSVDIEALAGIANRDFDGRGSYGRGQAEITLTQVLFNGFRIRSAVERADHTRLARYYELLDAVQGKALEAVQAYEDVLRYRDMVELAQRNYVNHQRVFKQIEQRAKSGVGNKADLLQISGRRSLAESNLLTEAANLHDVTARFERIVGRSPMADMAPLTLSAELPAGLKDVLTQAYSANPGFHATFESVAAAKAAVGEARSSFYPRLELRARQGIYENMNSFDKRVDPDPHGQEGVIELRGTYNIFRGGSDLAAERAAVQRMNQADDLRLKACVDLRQIASIAFNDVSNLGEKLDTLRAHKTAAASVVTAYRDQFDIGRRSLLDVLDSENEAFQAERALVQGEYDLAVARYRTLATMGTLLPALGVSREGLPTLGDLDAEPVRVTPETVCPALDEQNLTLAALRPADVDEAPAPLPARKVALAGDALFDTGKSDIRPAALDKLSETVARLKAEPGPWRVAIVGYTDSSGSAAVNRSLSLARAIAVKDHLVAGGLDAALITVEGAGASRPVADNATAEGRAANRRVEISISK